MSSPQSIEIIDKFLSKRGYECESITLSGRRFVQIKKDGQVLLTADYANPLYPFVTSSARLISKHKNMAYDFVQMNGITIPKTATVQSDEDLTSAISILEEFKSVILKPKQGSGSKGLYLNIRDENDLRQAIKDSLESFKTVLIQQQLQGEEARFVIVNGKTRGVLLRQKPYVIGDGFSTIADLIKVENRKRLALTDTLVHYPQLDETLVDPSLLYSEKVLKIGERQELNKNTMIRGGASMFNITEEIHPGYMALAEKAAAFGNGFIVVDMMIQDEKSPPAVDNYGFIEFNLAPALSLFYSCRDGKHLPVVEDYLGPMIIKAVESMYT